MTADVVFLLDVDNTLVDNDRIVADLREHLEHEFGAQRLEVFPVAGCTGDAKFALEVPPQVNHDAIVVQQRVVDVEQEHHVRCHDVLISNSLARRCRGAHMETRPFLAACPPMHAER